MSRYTALLIISWGDCIKCYGYETDNKWAGSIWLEEPRYDGEFIRPRRLVSTETIYKSEAEAVAAMKELVNNVREREAEILDASYMEGRDVVS